MLKTRPFDAVLLIAFGGPQGQDDVLPFLHNVLRGRKVPDARVQEVAKHYDLFNGIFDAIFDYIFDNIFNDTFNDMFNEIVNNNIQRNIQRKI